MIKTASLILLILLLPLGNSVVTAELPNHHLLEQARSQCAERLSYALENNVSIELTSDGKSFYVLWFPERASFNNPSPMIVTIHGHASWAFDEFYLWHKAAQRHGYGILAIQWWLGQGERSEDYLMPQEIYRTIDQVLTREKIIPQTVLFHGFSRGSANSYAVAALDNTRGKKYFGLIVANAGKPGSDYQPNREIEKGLFGEMPLKGTHWLTFAGGRDPNPDRDGIYGMREAAEWIRRYGGIIDLVIEDEDADHGGFHRNPENMESAFMIFKKDRK